MPGSRHLLNACLVLLPASMLYGVGHAQEPEIPFDFTPRVSLSQIYSDNIELSPPGEEDSEWVTELNAGFSLERQGAQARARLDYNLQGLAYSEESDRNDVFHQLAGDGRVDVVPERLFVEARAGYDQRQIARGRAGGDNINVTGNKTDRFTLSLSPVLIQRWGDTAAGQLRYTHDRVDFRDDAVTDDGSYSNSVLARVDSGPAFTRVGWGLSYDWRDTQFDDGSSVTLRQAEALGRFFATPSTSVFATVGQEDNDFTQDPSRSRPDDSFWRVGATHNPDDRTFLEAFAGERFFGTTYGGTARYQLRNGVVSANYTEQLQTVNRFDLTSEFFVVVIDDNPVLVELEVPDLRTGVFLSKRFTASVSQELQRLTWNVSVFDDQREFEIDDTRERVQGVQGGLRWQLGPRTRLVGNASVGESTFADQPDRDDTLYGLDVGVQRDIGPRTTASLAYLFRERDSNTAANDYRENRVTATVNRRF